MKTTGTAGKSFPFAREACCAVNSTLLYTCKAASRSSELNPYPPILILWLSLKNTYGST